MVESNKQGSPKPKAVQVKNPRMDRWVKFSTKTGRVISVKKSEGPYKGVPKKN